MLSALFILLSNVAFAQSDSVEVPYVTNANLAIIQLPAGFEPSLGFNGYTHKKAATSVVMTNIHKVTAEAMDGAWEQDSSRVLVERLELTTDAGEKVFAYKEEAQAGTLRIIQYTVFIDGSNKVLWLSISYPAVVDEQMEAIFMAAIKQADLTLGS